MLQNVVTKHGAIVFFGLLAALCLVAGSIILTIHLPKLFDEKEIVNGRVRKRDCDDVSGLYSASYKGKSNSLTDKIQAGCFFCCIIYPLAFFGFCCSWRLPNFMVLFAENYHILLHRMNIRKRKKELAKAHTDPETVAAARQNMDNNTPDTTPKSKISEDEVCGNQNQLNLDSDSNPESDDEESESEFFRDVQEEPDSESEDEAAPLIGGSTTWEDQPISGRFHRRDDTAYSLEDGMSRTSLSENPEPRPRRMSTDEARANFSMFTWVRETITADKKSLRRSAGADGVLLTGLLYRLLIMLAVLTLTVTLPLGSLYASYDWTTDVAPDEVVLPENYVFHMEHWDQSKQQPETIALTIPDEIQELYDNLNELRAKKELHLTRIRVPKQETDQALDGHDENIIDLPVSYSFKQWPRHGQVRVPQDLDPRDPFVVQGAHFVGRYVSKVKCVDPTKQDAAKFGQLKTEKKWRDIQYSNTLKPKSMEELRDFFAKKRTENVDECHVFFRGDVINSIFIQEDEGKKGKKTEYTRESIIDVLNDKCWGLAHDLQARKVSDPKSVCQIKLEPERAEWWLSPPTVQKNYRILEHQHDNRLVDVDGLQDHIGKTVLWVKLVNDEDHQRVPTVTSFRDLCATQRTGGKTGSICSGATLGLSAVKGILFNQCADHRLTDQQRWDCDNWFEIRTTSKLNPVAYDDQKNPDSPKLQELLDNSEENKLKSFPHLRADDPWDDDGTDDPNAVYLISTAEDLKKKDKFKQRVISIDGDDVQNLDHALHTLLPHAIKTAKKRKVNVVIDYPQTENVVRIKETATDKLTGEGHNFAEWTVTWMSNKPIGTEGFKKIPLVNAEGKADINVVTQNWSEPVYFHVQKYEPGWIDYISLVNVPFDKADVSSCPGATTRFFVIACFVWIITIGVLWLINSMMTLMKKERRRFLKKLDWPQSHALIYKNVPLKQATQHDVELYFDTLFPDRWRSVLICREVGHGSIRRLYQRYEAANKTYQQALVDANIDINTPPEDLYVFRPSMRSFFAKDTFRSKMHSSKDISNQSSSCNAIADTPSSASNTPSVAQYADGPANENVTDGNDADDDDNEVDIVDKTEKQIETSTKLSPVEKAALRVVRIKTKLKQKWDADEVGEDIAKPIDNPSVIVTFKSRIDKIEAADVTLEFKRTKPEVFNSTDPKDVRYWDLATHATRTQMQVVGYGFIVAVFIAFVPLVLILGYVTKPKTVEKMFPFLHEWKEEGGIGEMVTNIIFMYVPPLLLNTIAGIMVMLFLFIGSGLCSFPTGAALQRWACRVFFWFNMIFIVFGVMAVKMVFEIMTKPDALNDLQSAARTVWKQAPDAAVFGITYIFVMIQGVALRLLLNWARWLWYVLYWIVYKSKDKALEAVSLKNEISYAFFGWMTEVYVYIEVCLALTLAFCLITPIILPVGLVFLLCLLPIMKFNLLIRVPDDFTDSGGKIWMQSLRHLLWIMGFFYAFTICICVLRLSLNADGGISVVFIVIGAMCFFYLIAIWIIGTYKFEYLPLYEARKMQVEDESWAGSHSFDGSHSCAETQKQQRFVQPEIEFMTRMPKDYKAQTSGSSWCEERKNARKHTIDQNIPEEDSHDILSSEEGNDTADLPNLSVMNN